MNALVVSGVRRIGTSEYSPSSVNSGKTLRFEEKTTATGFVWRKPMMALRRSSSERDFEVFVFDFADDLDALGLEVVEEAGELEPGAVDFGEVDECIVRSRPAGRPFPSENSFDGLRERDRINFRHFGYPFAPGPRGAAQFSKLIHPILYDISARNANPFSVKFSRGHEKFTRAGKAC